MYGFGSCTVAFLVPTPTDSNTSTGMTWVTLMPSATEECSELSGKCKFHIVWRVVTRNCFRTEIPLLDEYQMCNELLVCMIAGFVIKT